MNEEQFKQAVNAMTTITVVVILLIVIIAATIMGFKARSDADAVSRLIPLLVVALAA